jgi:hypothetical protein
MKPKAKPALTARERLLLLVLPGALVLAIYAVFINGSPSRRTDQGRPAARQTA